MSSYVTLKLREEYTLDQIMAPNELVVLDSAQLLSLSTGSRIPQPP